MGLRAVMYRHMRAHSWREPKHEDTGAHHEDLTHSYIVGRSWKNIPAKTTISKRRHWPTGETFETSPGDNLGFFAQPPKKVYAGDQLMIMSSG